METIAAEAVELLGTFANAGAFLSWLFTFC
jgi:hypothetical protein